jgi:hypothetical protein
MLAESLFGSFSSEKEQFRTVVKKRQYRLVTKAITRRVGLREFSPEVRLVFVANN